MQIRRLHLIQNTESTTIKATTRAGEPAQREQSNATLNNCRWAARRESYQGPHAPVREHASLNCSSTSLVHAIYLIYTMLDWHPNAHITQARLEPRDRLSVGDVALWSLLSRVSSGSAARASIGVHAKVPSAGAGATRCAVLGPDQLSTTTKRVVALKTCAASKLFRCSGVP
jgi:hypothetical protein